MIRPAMTMPDEPPLTPPDTPLDMTITTGAAPANPAGEWVTVSEAVARTGKAERTVRRWVDEGLLDSKRQAGRLLIWMPATGEAPAIDVISDGQNATREIALIERQAELIERLSRQQAEMAEQQAAPLIALIKEQAERLSMLERENGRLEAELEAEIERHMPADAAPDTRPWWRRWFN